MKYKAEFGDVIQFLLGKYSNHQLHCVLYFHQQIDVECMNKAILVSMDLIPIIRSKFVINRKPYWETISNSTNVVIIKDCEESQIDNEMDKFFAKRINIFQGPQALFLLIRSEIKDTFCIIINHMVTDAAGFKEYLYLLASIYSGIKSSGRYIPKTLGIMRNLKEIIANYSAVKKIKKSPKVNYKSNNVYRMNKKVPASFVGELDNLPFIIKQKISEDMFTSIKEYSQKRKVTINDIIMSAFIRTIYKFFNIPEYCSLDVPCPVDIRRYLQKQQRIMFCNLSPVVMCNIGPYIGKSFDETVKKINEVMEREKFKLPLSKIHSSKKLQFLVEHIPFRIFSKIFIKVFPNPSFVMTNIGIIEDERLKFGDVILSDAFITGSIKEPPAWQMSVSTFKNKMWFCINLRGTEADKEIIKSFLRLFTDELALI